jgi:hypothetical protein
MGKKLLILLTAALFFVSFVTAQSNTGREMTVEESYLQESIEIMIIRETARSEVLDQKLFALEKIKEAMDNNRKSPEIRQSLDYLALEGSKNQIRESGRVINNFPLVRRQAAKLLGKFDTSEAKNALLEVCQFDKEPMVIQEAIRSLGDIGLNENGDTVSTIVYVVSRLDVVNPDNLVALATIDCFEKIAKKNGGINDPNAINLLIKISAGQYIKPVQERAKQLINDLMYGERNN